MARLLLVLIVNDPQEKSSWLLERTEEIEQTNEEHS